ncbi:hypothetical protein C8J57DRAFT_1576216 [Mycena rebaudengoi]|nr:hypothetical protein C8J57DRAFT_1576216 [Mycena rebaudengoi]
MTTATAPLATPVTASAASDITVTAISASSLSSAADTSGQNTASATMNSSVNTHPSTPLPPYPAWPSSVGLRASSVSTVPSSTPTAHLGISVAATPAPYANLPAIPTFVSVSPTLAPASTMPHSLETHYATSAAALDHFNEFGPRSHAAKDRNPYSPFHPPWCSCRGTRIQASAPVLRDHCRRRDWRVRGGGGETLRVLARDHLRLLRRRSPSPSGPRGWLWAALLGKGADILRRESCRRAFCAPRRGRAADGDVFDAIDVRVVGELQRAAVVDVCAA